MKVFTKIEEFLATKSPVTKPTTKPTVVPKPTPQKPSPIRRDKPAADPAPKAKAEDVVKRFLTELRKAKAPIEFDILKLKQRYND